MNTFTNNLSCAEFQAQLPELIGSGEVIANHSHFKDCKQCQKLLGDLEAIAEAARHLFPIEEPPDALWNQIESAIENEEANHNLR
ncbi:MAG: hypothetical protein ABSB60_17135 [Terracidiphilus sp.]